MTPLPTEFFKYNDHHQLVFREGKVALFRRTSPLRRTSWEVIIVQAHEGREAFGVQMPAAEYYPSTGSWGTLGWTCPDRASADERVNDLCIRFGTRKAIPARRRSPVAPELQTLQTPDTKP